MKLTGLFAFVTVLALAAAAQAQIGYFGQNKVQYRTFKFQVLKTSHFDIYYYPEEEASARMAGRMAERWYERLSGLFTHELRNRQVVVLYASGSQFRQTNVVEGDLGEGTGGVTEAYKRRIVLPFAGPIQSTDHVLGHELVHAFQYDITNTNASSAAAGQGGVMNLPLWFIEGMAEYLSLGPADPNTAMWMREAIRRDRFPTIAKLDDPRYFPYRYGQALWAYIGGKYGDRTIPSLLRAAVGRDGYEGAFQRVLGVKSKELSTAWHDATLAAYRPVAETTKMPSAFAHTLIVDPSKTGGGINVSPELSPDGSKVVFFSSRDLFSIDLYVADATDGHILRKLTDTATDPHLDSIEFIDSAGAWAHDSRRFAYPALAGGDPVLRIVNAENGDEAREIPFKDLDQVVNPTWSPDDTRIAFTGLAGGVTDLFIYDVRSSQLRRVTSDAFAELQPAWSPDGRTIAIGTDRFSSNLESLRAGNMRLGLVDVETGAIRDLGGFDDAKNINPQWSADGRTIYFISDRMGISNLYRIDAQGGSPAEVTNLLTGVAGITDMSPAISAAATRVAFSVYENDGYNIYTLDTAQARTADVTSGLARNAGILPPRTALEGPISAYLGNPVAGLPPLGTGASYPTEPYRPKLQLDFLGQPMVGVGVDSFGSYVGGGISAMLSDTLGNHVVGLGVNVSNRFDEAGGSTMYLNRTHRWNWGVALDQTPYVLRGISQGLTGSVDQPLIREDETRVLQIDRGFSGILMYPFSRAQRLELNAGLRQITGKVDVTTSTFDYYTGTELSRDTTTLSTFPTLNLGLTSGALVYDTSISGATSPLRGTRYRLQLDHSAGDLTYSSALADGRRYFMPVRPLTFAVRGMYYGRYGRDAESPYLAPVFIGYPELVRGYDYNTFDASECNAVDGTCPVLDQLFGSRMAVFNAELRAPLLGLFGRQDFYGPLPVDVGVFADAGAAWGQGSALHLTGPDRNLVRSVGVLLRANLLGFAVAQIDYARPLDRPGRGWIWQFSLRPGF